MDSMKSYVSFDDLKRNYDATVADKQVYPLQNNENNNNLTCHDINDGHLIEEQDNQILKENNTKKRFAEGSKKNLKKQRLDLNVTSTNSNLLEKFKVN
jgi:hypothetical protein